MQKLKFGKNAALRYLKPFQWLPATWGGTFSQKKLLAHKLVVRKIKVSCTWKIATGAVFLKTDHKFPVIH